MALKAEAIYQLFTELSQSERDRFMIMIDFENHLPSIRQKKVIRSKKEGIADAVKYLENKSIQGKFRNK